MTTALPLRILSENEGPVARVINAQGRAPILFVCEHASAFIPASLDDLGLAPEDRYSHAVWDPGAEGLARRLSKAFDAPLVLCGVSRLVYDCNRPPERPDAMPARTEMIEIPGNCDISADERAQRTEEIYETFHSAVAQKLDAFSFPPVFVTVHSFSPTWHGTRRPTEIGILHDDAAEFSEAMVASANSDFLTELNEPYSAADGVTHTLVRHATSRGLAHAMIEVRNDLLADDAGIDSVAKTLHRMIDVAMGQPAEHAG